MAAPVYPASASYGDSVSNGAYQFSSGGVLADDGALSAVGGSASKRRMSSAADGLSDDDDDTKPAKRKRNRVALSCTECKRRKIKCDRKLPCESCCKRGEQSLCHWEEAKLSIEPQPFALATEHERLRQRVDFLEQLLAPIAAASRNGVPAGLAIGSGASSASSHAQPETPSDIIGGGSTPGTTSLFPGQLAIAGARLTAKPALGKEEEDDPDSDTEDAALVLEELALGRKLTRVGARKDATNKLNYAAVVPSARRPASVSTPPALHGGPQSRIANSLLRTESLTKRHQAAWADIFSIMPTVAGCGYLVSVYCQTVDFGWHILHLPTFKSEFEAFKVHMARGKRDQLDPLWVAILCMVCCVTLNTLEAPLSTPEITLSLDQIETLTHELFDAARNLLEIGDWTGRPRIRTLQTIAMFCPYLLFQGTPTSLERAQTYLGAAFPICQQLALHKLGDDPSTMPPEDPALPTTVCSLRREVALRLFFTLLFVDYLSFRIKSSFPPHLIQSALPGNFDDLDLSETQLTAPKPSHVATDTTYEVLRFLVAKQHRMFNEVLTSGETFQFKTVLDVDKGFHDALQSLPHALREPWTDQNEPKTFRWRRCLQVQTIWNRLLRLHRPFMSRGYREPTFSYSTSAALDAARNILLFQRAIEDAPLVKSGFHLLHVQGAAVVLFMDLWVNFGKDSEAADRDYKLIKEALPFVKTVSSSRHQPIRKIAKQTIQVVEMLFEAIDRRRAEYTHLKSVHGPNAVEPEQETYSQLLKRAGVMVRDKTAGCAARKAAVSSPLPPAGLGVVDPTLAPLSQMQFFGTAPETSDSQFRAMGIYVPEEPLFEFGSEGFDLQSLLGPSYANPSFSLDDPFSDHLAGLMMDGVDGGGNLRFP